MSRADGLQMPPASYSLRFPAVVPFQQLLRDILDHSNGPIRPGKYPPQQVRVVTSTAR